MSRRDARTAALVGLALALAVACRWIDHGAQSYLDLFTSQLRPLIFIGLFALWGASVNRRVIQPSARRLLRFSAALLIFWMLDRTVKWEYAMNADVSRALWYLYYVPMILLPTISLLIANRLGLFARVKPSAAEKAVCAVSALLILLVFTNDAHQFVFSFPNGRPFLDKAHRLGPGYWLVVAWDVGVSSAALYLILRKCRLPRARVVRAVPFALLALFLGALLFLYNDGGSFIDLTAFVSCFYAALWEFCLRSRLVQTNTGDDEWMRASDIAVQIANRALCVELRGAGARTFDKDTLARGGRAVMLEGGVRLCEAPIRAGHVFWQEDVSELARTLSQIQETCEALKGYGTLLEEENRQKARRARLDQQQSLYARIRQTTRAQTEALGRLANELALATGAQAARARLYEIVEIAAYVKRRSNLVFLSEQSRVVPARELALCVNESVGHLRAMGVECGCALDISGDMPAECASRLYDFFEACVEAAFGGLSRLYVSAEARDARYTLALEAQCARDFAPVRARFPACTAQRDEDGIWYLRFSCAEGGAGA